MLKVTTLFFTFTLAASAQSGTRTQTNSHPSYSRPSFDVTATRLPVNFKGDNIVLLYNAFAKIDDAERSGKSEYETTDKFQTRMERLRRTVVVGNVTTRSVLAFVVPNVASTYDADTQILNFGISRGFRKGYSVVNNGYSFVIKSTSTRGTYRASNPFGVTTDVDKNWTETFEVTISNDEAYPVDPSTRIELPVSNARAIRNSLSALIVCVMNRLSEEPPNWEPLTDEGYEGRKPTLDSPTDTFTEKHYLNTQVLSIWFFDAASGKVYAKIEPTANRSNMSSPFTEYSPRTVEKPKPMVSQAIRVREQPAANLIRQIGPIYPPMAKQARIQGTVKFNAVIAKDGTVQNLTLQSGHPMLVQAALEAVKQWLYKPTMLNGDPVEVITTIDVAFTLSQ